MIQTDKLYEIFCQHPEIVTDSRQILPGCLFFALKGARFDGNQYALEALESGAAYAVIDDARLPNDPRLLLVEDVLGAMQALAREHRRRMGIPVIAITGTNGKTTTKELAAAVLSTTYRLLYTQGNLNNHIGVPLTLLRLRQEHQLALVEMGASKPGDIAELCAIAEPNYGIITNIGQAHLEGFGSLEGVLRTKGELYDWLRNHEGKAIRNADDPLLRDIADGIPSVLYGQGSEALIKGELLSQEAGKLFLELQWSAEVIGIEGQRQATQLVGAYNMGNVLAAVALGLFLDVPSEEIVRSIAAYSPSNSRSQLMHTPLDNLVIADAYNANPSSMHHALENFFAIESPRPRLLILGDMNELGTQAHEAHQSLYEEIQRLAQEGDQLWLCGPIWAGMGLTERTFASAVELEHYLSKGNVPHGHLILVKGSNGIRLNNILPKL